MSECKAFEVLHRASAEGPLDGDRQIEFDAHLTSCPPCMLRLKNYVLVTEVLRRLDPYDRELETPAPLAEGLVMRILAARKAAQSAREDRRTG